ncbi:hypothetical protein JHK82_022737 [Glycine max]|nr:hypothetical protein JHK82_022737 [Glycine max]
MPGDPNSVMILNTKRCRGEDKVAKKMQQNTWFQEPNDATLFDLLQFLHDTNSSFFINLYPYNLYHLNPKIPLGISLFQKHSFNFCNDFTFDVRYRNLFDVMVNAIIFSLFSFHLIRVFHCGF